MRIHTTEVNQGDGTYRRFTTGQTLTEGDVVFLYWLAMNADMAAMHTSYEADATDGWYEVVRSALAVVGGTDLTDEPPF